MSNVSKKISNEYTIIGIDPGTTRVGYGVIRVANRTFTLLDYGVIGKANQEKQSGMLVLAKELSRLIKHYHPDQAAVEKVFFFSNQKTAIPVAEFRGAILLTLAQHNLPITEFTPLEVKQAVSGYGRAGKDQVQNMVRLILGLTESIQPDDAADALAIAICAATVNPNP